MYDVIDVNVDNAYNASTGRFKAAVGGLFVFFATISTDSKTDIANESFCLIHNFHPADKTRQATACFERGSFKTKTLISSITLKEGDEIWTMRLCKSADRYGSRRKKYYSTFSGSLLERTK